MVHWSISPLVRWSIGPLVECRMLNVSKVKLLSERTSGVPPVILSICQRESLSLRQLQVLFIGAIVAVSLAGKKEEVGLNVKQSVCVWRALSSFAWAHPGNIDLVVCLQIPLKPSHRLTNTLMRVHRVEKFFAQHLLVREALIPRSSISKLLPLVFLLQSVYYLRKHLSKLILHWFWIDSNICWCGSEDSKKRVFWPWNQKGKGYNHLVSTAELHFHSPFQGYPTLSKTTPQWREFIFQSPSGPDDLGTLTKDNDCEKISK